MDGLKRGLILHTLQCLATLLNLDTHQHQHEHHDAVPQDEETPAVVVGPSSELAASKLSETPGLVEALAVVALSHPHVGRTGGAGGTHLGLGEQERVSEDTGHVIAPIDS